jgi:hypothetical protein
MEEISLLVFEEDIRQSLEVVKEQLSQAESIQHELRPTKHSRAALQLVLVNNSSRGVESIL